ncbi:hypothetical protein [Haliangium ochraceum]|uniref:hypothetical protein n=1 Tax=Haliangium ochraceum TaxID=80816 RepID=UPI001269BE4E|nr:hypothetical protein [Haliangium ochraceum]
MSRLAGQRVRVDGAGYRILDIAGEGPPLVGVVERRDDGLWLRGEDGARYRLRGPLAKPRIAGPGYKVWVLGRAQPAQTQGAGAELWAQRLGVLAPPWARAESAQAERKTSLEISDGAPTRTGGPQ